MKQTMRESGRRPARERHKKSPRMIKGFVRIAAGKSILYLTTGTNTPVKILRDDVQTLETNTGKHVEEMEEEELQQTMNRLSISQITRTDDEQQIARLATKHVLAGFFILSEDESTS